MQRSLMENVRKKAALHFPQSIEQDSDSIQGLIDPQQPKVL
jgi:hypothetical protein